MFHWNSRGDENIYFEFAEKTLSPRNLIGQRDDFRDSLCMQCANSSGGACEHV